MSAHGVVAQLVEHLHGMQGVVGSSPISSTKETLVDVLGHLMTCNTHLVGSSPISSTKQLRSGHMTHSMADIAQLVRALVCGTKCRRFESGYPPHYKKAPRRGVFC